MVVFTFSRCYLLLMYSFGNKNIRLRLSKLKITNIGYGLFLILPVKTYDFAIFAILRNCDHLENRIVLFCDCDGHSKNRIALFAKLRFYRNRNSQFRNNRNFRNRFYNSGPTMSGPINLFCVKMIFRKICAIFSV